MAGLDLRVAEGCAPQPTLLWDTAFDPLTGYADWAYADASEAWNAGGLAARAALETAVVLCLFTDAACPPDHPLAGWADSGDLRGWWGDAVDVRADLGERPMGSLLWLLERATATPRTAMWARQFALESLAVLVDQGAAARVDAQAELGDVNRLDLAVQVYGRDGAKLYDRRFDDIWRQTA